MGRAYYAAYHWAAFCAEGCCPLIDRSSVKGGSHEYLIGRYVALATPQGRSVAWLLRDLKAGRELADYEVVQAVSRQEVDAHIATVRKVLEKISMVTGVPLPAEPKDDELDVA
ncbi:hypothetical protein dqs_0622 [Azoarcus olearius]|nr:hypothetical protein dqs_0622 [Azoarcus olearius]